MKNALATSSMTSNQITTKNSFADSHNSDTIWYKICASWNMYHIDFPDQFQSLSADKQDGAHLTFEQAHQVSTPGHQAIAGVWEVFQGVKRHEEIPNCETLLNSFETFFALLRSRRFCATYDNYNH